MSSHSVDLDSLIGLSLTWLFSNRSHFFPKEFLEIYFNYYGATQSTEAFETTQNTPWERMQSPSVYWWNTFALQNGPTQVSTRKSKNQDTALISCVWSLERWAWIQKQCKTYLSNTMDFKGNCYPVDLLDFYLNSNAENIRNPTCCLLSTPSKFRGKVKVIIPYNPTREIFRYWQWCYSNFPWHLKPENCLLFSREG